MEPSDALPSFRRSFYECLHRRGHALFELADAILTADGAARSHPAGKLVLVSPPDAIDQFLADRSGGHGTKALLIAMCHLCSPH